MIALPSKRAPLRIKEWDYYCILTPRFGLALTVADNGYLGFLGTSWLDLEHKTATNHGAIIRGRWAR